MNKQISVGKFDQNASLKKGIVVCLLAAALLVSMVGMASAATVWHHLDSVEGAASGIYKMWKDDGSECSGSVAITSGGSKIWTSNVPASCDVGFGGKLWNANIMRVGTTGEEKFTAYIGYYDGSTFHSGGSSGEKTIPDGEAGLSFSFNAGAFTVPEGNWLAYKVESSTGVTVDCTTGDSYVFFVAPPAYPVPELNTLVLLSVGLLALAGFVVYSRSRRRNGKAK